MKDREWGTQNTGAVSIFIKVMEIKTCLVVQWLRFHTPNTGGLGLLPGQGTKILHVTQCNQKKKIFLVKKKKNLSLIFKKPLDLTISL